MAGYRSPSPLVAFYEDEGPDSRGRFLAEILQWSASELEFCHDYIQTLFPLPERSVFNDPAPVIDEQVFEIFHKRKDLRDRLRDSFEKILWFYGFELCKAGDGKLEVSAGPNFSKHSQNWNMRFNHNHLRITRIIRSLRVLGLEQEALAFYNALACASKVSSRSRMYWGRAAHRPLHISPDIDEEYAEIHENIGLRFLREYEQKFRGGFEITD